MRCKFFLFSFFLMLLGGVCYQSSCLEGRGSTSLRLTYSRKGESGSCWNPGSNGDLNIPTTLSKVANSLTEWFLVYRGYLRWEVVFKILERSHSSGYTWPRGSFVFHPYHTLTNSSFARCDMVLCRRIKSSRSTTMIYRACQWGHKFKGWTSRRCDI